MGRCDRQIRRETQDKLAIALLARVVDRPVRAIEFADECGVSGATHETKRRRVRELIERLHALGHRVCASSGSPQNCGYWLAKTVGEWAAYLAARKSGARFEFVKTRQMQSAATDRISDQATLFGGGGEEHGSQSRGTRTAWATA